MKTIRFTGVFDNSGYGWANKQTFLALLATDFTIGTQVINTPMSRHEYSVDPTYDKVVAYQDILKSTRSKPDINIVQLVPVFVDHFFIKGSYNILYFFWETDRICQDWVDRINNSICEEVWVPCPTNRIALIDSGVKKPVYVIPQYTPVEVMPEEDARQILSIPNREKYNFYSTFQWTERKNPKALLRAYFEEFKKEDNVQLVLKTYGPSPFTDRRWIKEAILEMKEQYVDAAPVFYLGELLKPNEVNAIHPQCQCYVYTGRGEGWNIPLVESMTYGKQVITTKTGGIADWIDEKSAYVIPHKIVPIDAANQAWGQFYQSIPSQNWGDVDIKEVQKAMRLAYNEKNDYSYRIKFYKDVLKICEKEEITDLMKERLRAIKG